MLSDPTVLILMYFVLPIWLLAGFADWLCHRATHIETTTGAKESLIHLLMFGEVGVPLLAAMFLDVNALIIAIMSRLFLARGHGTVGRELCDGRPHPDADRTARPQLSGNDPADGYGQRDLAPLGTISRAVRRGLRACAL